MVSFTYISFDAARGSLSDVAAAALGPAFQLATHFGQGGKKRKSPHPREVRRPFPLIRVSGGDRDEDQLLSSSLLATASGMAMAAATMPASTQGFARKPKCCSERLASQ